MRNLPTGTVTFLFTDIDGSTRLLHELGQAAYADALAEHRRVLREAFAANGGVEVDTQGDAFFVAFSTAAGAVAAAAQAQTALAGGRVAVRMGLHTGTPHVTGEGYVGEDVHLGARVAASGHGGQVLLSKTTRDLLDGTEFRDLGEHRLKDFEQPVWIYQIGDALFPPLKTISNTNLPRPASSFVGRDREVGEVVGLLREGARLATLTGPGGSGKTRLAIEAAAELVGEFRNGVFWVGLATVRDPELVLPTIGQTLGARAELATHVGEKELLLLLDNLEQVVQAAPQLASLVEACPNLRLLITSRELLRVRGEVEYEVLPLAQPDAVDLFCLRSGLQGSQAIEELCRRLDNMPLALELAAARARVLSPEQILERLSQRLDLFKGGRDADPRQQTLRATIEWSYELLDPGEQELFARLSVFTGGFTLEACESVAQAELDTLQGLTEKSLLRHSAERYWLLETIREFAVERLEESDPAEWRGRHAGFFLTMAETVEPELSGERQAEWLELLELDYPNLRAALAWFLKADAPGPALRLAGALRPFWFKRGYLSEGRRWVEDVLAASGEQSPARAKALAAAGLLAALQGDWPETKRWSEAGRKLSLELGELRFAAWSLMTLGRAMLAEGDPEGAVLLYEEARRYGREVGDVDTIGMVAFNLGYIALSSGDFGRARNELEAAVEEFGGERYGVTRSLAALGSVALHERRHDDAIVLLRRSLGISRELGDRDDMAWALQLLGVAYCESEPERAARLLGAAEALREALGGRLDGVELTLHEQALAALTPLGPEVRSTAWAAGRRLSVDEAAEYALSVDSRP